MDETQAWFKLIVEFVAYGTKGSLRGPVQDMLDDYFSNSDVAYRLTPIDEMTTLEEEDAKQLHQ